MTEQVKKTRKPRFKGHEPYNAMLRKDWIRAIEMDPDNFDAHLYRPIEVKAGQEQGNYEQSSVIELDTHQDLLTYSEPELVAVLDCPDEQESFFMMADGEDSLGESIEPLVLKMAAHDIPIGSVLEWDEEAASGIRTVWWYVHKAMGYGTSNIGALYICVPMRDFNKTGPDTNPNNESQSAIEETEPAVTSTTNEDTESLISKTENLIREENTEVQGIIEL